MTFFAVGLMLGAAIGFALAGFIATADTEDVT